MRLSPDNPKCLCVTDRWIFMGLWNNRVLVYDVKDHFKLVKNIKTKAGVRSMCIFSETTLLCGENDGWIDLIRISDNLK